MVNPFDRLQDSNKVRRSDEKKASPVHSRKKPKKEFKEVMRGKKRTSNMPEEKPEKEVAVKPKQEKGTASIFDHSMHKPKVAEKKEDPSIGLEEGKFGPRQEFAQEVPDLEAVGPALAKSIQSLNVGAPVAKSETAPTQQLNKLWSQMVQKIQTMEQTGKMDTTVTFKSPPLFAGAKVTLTAFDTAKGEFDVRFTDLTPKAEQLLLNAQDGLKQALAQKGFVLHNYLITEQKEEFIAQAEQSSSSRGKEERHENEEQEQEKEE